MDQAAGAKPDTRECTCHPDDAPRPCPRKFAAHHCWKAAVYEEARKAIIELKNRDTTVMEQRFLNFLKRVERALEE